jgi:hypothetical protein
VRFAGAFALVNFDASESNGMLNSQLKKFRQQLAEIAENCDYNIGP